MIKSLKKKLKRQERVKNFDLETNNNIVNLGKSIIADNPLIFDKFFITRSKMIEGLPSLIMIRVNSSLREKVINKILFKDKLL